MQEIIIDLFVLLALFITFIPLYLIFWFMCYVFANLPLIP